MDGPSSLVKAMIGRAGRNPGEEERREDRTRRGLPRGLGRRAKPQCLGADLDRRRPVRPRRGEPDGAWLPFYASIGGNGQRSVDEVCHAVEQWLALGPAQVKIRFDADKTARDVDLAGDIAKARAVRKLAGDDFPLAFDANNGYSVQGAIRVGRALEELGYVWFEEPVQHYHVESFA